MDVVNVSHDFQAMNQSVDNRSWGWFFVKILGFEENSVNTSPCLHTFPHVPDHVTVRFEALVKFQILAEK